MQFNGEVESRRFLRVCHEQIMLCRHVIPCTALVLASASKDATLMDTDSRNRQKLTKGRLESMVNGAVFHSFHVYYQGARRELGIIPRAVCCPGAWGDSLSG